MESMEDDFMLEEYVEKMYKRQKRHYPRDVDNFNPN